MRGVIDLASSAAEASNCSAIISTGKRPTRARSETSLNCESKPLDEPGSSENIPEHSTSSHFLSGRRYRRSLRYSVYCHCEVPEVRISLSWDLLISQANNARSGF